MALRGTREGLVRKLSPCLPSWHLRSQILPRGRRHPAGAQGGGGGLPVTVPTAQLGTRACWTL